MESILFLGGLGLLSTIGLALLTLRPYALAILGLSFLLAQALANNSVDAVKTFLDILPFAFVMLGVQLAALLGAFIVISAVLAPSRARHPAVALLALIPLSGPLLLGAALYIPFNGSAARRK